jgi:hypothetical protein
MKNTKRILLSSALILGCAEVAAATGIYADATGTNTTAPLALTLADGSAWVTTANNDALDDLDQTTPAASGTIYAGHLCSINIALNLGARTVTTIRGLDDVLSVTAVAPGSSGPNAVEYYNSFTVSGFGGGSSKTTYIPKAAGKTLRGFAGAMSHNLHVDSETSLATFTSLTGTVTGSANLTLPASCEVVSGNLSSYTGTLTTGAATSGFTTFPENGTISAGFNITSGVLSSSTIGNITTTAAVSIDLSTAGRNVTINNLIIPGSASITLIVPAGYNTKIATISGAADSAVLNITANAAATITIPKAAGNWSCGTLTNVNNTKDTVILPSMRRIKRPNI